MPCHLQTVANGEAGVVWNKEIYAFLNLLTTLLWRMRRMGSTINPITTFGNENKKGLRKRVKLRSENIRKAILRVISNVQAPRISTMAILRTVS